MTSHYLNQCWPDSLRHVCSTRGRWVNALNCFEETWKHTHIFYNFSILRWRRSLKFYFQGDKGLLSCTVNTMVVDGLVMQETGPWYWKPFLWRQRHIYPSKLILWLLMQWARSSAALTDISQNISVSTPDAQYLDMVISNADNHYDVIKWKHFSCYCPLLRGIHQWLAYSPDKGTVTQISDVSLLLVWTNCWTNIWPVIQEATIISRLHLTDACLIPSDKHD